MGKFDCAFVFALGVGFVTRVSAAAKAAPAAGNTKEKKYKPDDKM